MHHLSVGAHLHAHGEHGCGVHGVVRVKLAWGGRCAAGHAAVGRGRGHDAGGHLGGGTSHLLVRTGRGASPAVGRRHGRGKGLRLARRGHGAVGPVGHVVLLLPGHQQALLVLLLEQHQLHLVVLQGVVAVVGVCGTLTGHGTHLRVEEFGGVGILRHLGRSVGHQPLVHVRIHGGLHLLAHGVGIYLLHRFGLGVGHLRLSALREPCGQSVKTNLLSGHALRLTASHWAHGTIEIVVQSLALGGWGVVTSARRGGPLFHGRALSLHGCLLHLRHLLHAELLLHLHLLLVIAVGPPCQRVQRPGQKLVRNSPLTDGLHAHSLGHLGRHLHAGRYHARAHGHVGLHLGIDAHQPLSLTSHAGLMLRVSGAGAGEGGGDSGEQQRRTCTLLRYLAVCVLLPRPCWALKHSQNWCHQS